jgi:hypothetical protein
MNMNIEWLHGPILVATSLSLAAACLIASLALWISAKIEARASRKGLQTFRLSMETTIKELGARVEELRSAPAPNRISSDVTTVQSLNLTTRAKALRMYRSGETVSSIAATLGVQREEIDLLLKLERLFETRVA